MLLSESAAISQKLIERSRLDGDCWLWETRSGRINKNWYGGFYINGKKYYAHRASFELFNGPLEDRKFICHTCDCMACINPSHLWQGTPKENSQDMSKKCRSSKQERNPCSKLTMHKASQIRTLYSTGKYTLQELANRFGSSKTRVFDVVKNRRWL